MIERLFNDDYVQENHIDDLYLTVKKASEHSLSIVHKHNHLQIWYLLKGKFRHIINGKSYTHSAGELLFLPPYIPHQLDTRDSTDLEWIYINLGDDFLKAFPEGPTKHTLFDLICLRPIMYNALSATPFLSFSDKTTKRIEELLFELLNECENQSELSPLFMRTITVRLLALVTKEYTDSFGYKERSNYSHYRVSLQDALDYINNNYTKQITLEETCKIALMSRSSFSYIFQQLTGKTLVEYIHHLRIRHAKKLIIETDMSVMDICMDCGFRDVTFFGRIFKKIVGCSPRQFKKFCAEDTNTDNQVN